MHRELQRLAALSPPATFDAAESQRRFFDELAELGVPQELRSAAVARVTATPYSQCWATNADAGCSTRHTPIPPPNSRSGRIGGELLHVVIDRSFVVSGRRWVVD